MEGEKVNFDVGDADQIKEKYQKQGFDFDKDVKDQSKKKARIAGKTKISAHIYRFKGCISECFEPYLQGYSETEENKISEVLDSAMDNDQIEEGEYPFYNSSLLMFAEIKKSISRCTSFSNTKTFLDLHTSFKNIFRHYAKQLKRIVPTIGSNAKSVLSDDEEL
jgi:formate dehydrogenase maturation protein FdhE